MTAFIVLAALAVMALAALAGTGRFGQWEPVVTDRPKGFLPEGEIDSRFLSELRIPAAPYGYDRTEVMSYLERISAGENSIEDPQFKVVSKGFDMGFVDEILDRPSATRTDESASSPLATVPDGAVDVETALPESQHDPAVAQPEVAEQPLAVVEPLEDSATTEVEPELEETIPDLSAAPEAEADDAAESGQEQSAVEESQPAENLQGPATAQEPVSIAQPEIVELQEGVGARTIPEVIAPAQDGTLAAQFGESEDKSSESADVEEAAAQTESAEATESAETAEGATAESAEKIMQENTEKPKEGTAPEDQAQEKTDVSQEDTQEELDSESAAQRQAFEAVLPASDEVTEEADSR